MQRFISFLECLSAPSSDSFHSLALATEFSFHDSVPGFSNTMMIRRVAVVMASSLLVFLSVVAVIVLFSPPGFRSVLSSGHGSTGPSSFKSDAGNNNNTLSATHRKLLLRDTAMEEPNRMWGEKCSKADILINQGPTAPLPSGIPTYTVEIMNVCVTGCDISGIHLSCGWFSSARLVNPRVFKRLHYNDCLVNDGKPLVNGGTLSFQYANTFLYPLKVSAVHCH